MKQVKALKEAAENPNKKENKEKAENASLILKDLSAGAAIKSILNRIREILGLEAF
ncbi:hypothetical protein IQ238_14575 [Pleurocapsales cyanobacterium LEGE 06147]|nr:hypothetical protein [Pleurocapsales cyanobacterium LEGE 06147]